MGGNGLKNCKVKRISPAEYEIILSAAIEIISRYFEMVAVPKFVDSKKDFGDVDIIVCSQKDKSLDKTTLLDTIKKKFNSVEMVVNGSTTFFEFSLYGVFPENLSIQTEVEVIEVPDEKRFLAKVNYLNWGILSTLVGLLANSMGLWYSESGLYLIVNEEPNRLEKIATMEAALNQPVPDPILYDQPITRKSDGKKPTLKEIYKVLLTEDQSEVYSFLGYPSKVDVENLHFTCDKEVFDFVMNFGEFQPGVYLSNGSERLCPFLKYLKDQVDKGRQFAPEPQYPKIFEMNLDKIYDISVPQDTFIWDKRVFHRKEALEHFHKTAEYVNAVRTEWLKNIAETLAPKDKFVKQIAPELRAKTKDWLMKFQTAKAMSYPNQHPDLSKFPELSAYNKWVLEQGTTAAIEDIMRNEKELHMPT